MYLTPNMSDTPAAEHSHQVVTVAQHTDVVASHWRSAACAYNMSAEVCCWGGYDCWQL